MTTTSPSHAGPDPVISVRGLRRSYGDFEAVRGVDLDVAAGTITALLGTNGAGKTSTLEVVEGLSRPSGGTVRVLGLDPVADRAEVRRRCGILLQRSGFSGDLTVTETLRLWASTLSRPRPVADALAMLSLDHRRDVRVSALSGGEQRRLDIACTLMGDPEVVFLDEPTTGLDPESRRDLWQLVRGLRDAGTTVVLSTHYLEEAEVLADRLEIMHGGRIVRSGTPAQIADGHPSTISFRTPYDGLPDVGSDPRIRRVVESAGTTTLETDDLQHTLTVLLDAARRSGVRLDQLAARTASLESVFLQVAASAAGSDTDSTEEVAA
jgi:ABC-2 type transport system ATP-binding protein